MKERIFTTKEQGRVLVEAGLPISTASGFRDKYLDQLHSMEDNAGRIGLIEAVTPDVSNPVWDVGTLLNLLPYEIEGSTFECYKLEHAWSVAYREDDLSLSDRTFACGNCGIKIDRDLNAAINIKRMGVDILYNRTSRDEVTSPGEAFKIK